MAGCFFGTLGSNETCFLLSLFDLNPVGRCGRMAKPLAHWHYLEGKKGEREKYKLSL